MASKRPMVNVYEPDGEGAEHLVYREMNDAESKQYEYDQQQAAALTLDHFRAERTARLAASDWTQMPDAPIDSATRARWATYRQALRDLPDTKDLDPSDPVWPAPPT